MNKSLMKMNVSSLQDFQRCRLCALPISSNTLIPFFDTIYEPMIGKLKSFGLQIRKDDGLPESICQGCTGILTTFIETMELFLAADKKLKKLLEISKVSNSDKNMSVSKITTESNEDLKRKSSKRKTEEDDIEIIETKKAKRRDFPNLLRKSRTLLLSDSRNEDNNIIEQKSEPIANKKNKESREQSELPNKKKNEETKEKSDSLKNEINERTEVRKKHERKENLQTIVRSDSVDSTTQDFTLKSEAEKPKDCEHKEPSNFEIINAENHDHNYGMVRNKSKTEEANIKNNVSLSPKVEDNTEISEESDPGTQINKTSLSKNVKIITFENLGIPGKLQTNLPTSSNALPSVYTQPSDDKEIDVFTCLECSQISWNRKETLEHIYKEHAQGAITYKARYMVKRVKNTIAYNPQNQIVCLLCRFTVDDSYSYFEHLTGHYMAIFKCVHCYYNFSSKEALQKHKLAHRHDIITCKLCDKSMALEYYNAHERTHSLNAHFQRKSEAIQVKSTKRSKIYGQTNNNRNKERKIIVNAQNTIPVKKEIEKIEVSEKKVVTEENEIAEENVVDKSEEATEENVPEKKEIVEKIQIAEKREVTEEIDLQEETFKQEMKEDERRSVANENSSNNIQKPVKTDDNKFDEEHQKMSLVMIKTEMAKEKPVVYKCSACQKALKERNAILRHIQRIHPEMWANKRSPFRATRLEIDDEEVDSKEIYMCRFCTIDFDTECKYTNHLEAYHSCKYCSKTFQHKDEVQIHQRSHEKPYRCDICDASFYVEKNYVDHKLTHSYQCEFCKASYRTEESLTNHKKIVHPKISCPICSVGFESRELLIKHEATHAKKKTPSLCELCGKSYSNTTRFNCHMLTHSKDSEFSCQFCPMSFKSAAKLKRHQRFSHLEDYTESLRENID